MYRIFDCYSKEKCKYLIIWQIFNKIPVHHRYWLQTFFLFQISLQNRNINESEIGIFIHKHHNSVSYWEEGVQLMSAIVSNSFSLMIGLLGNYILSNKSWRGGRFAYKLLPTVKDQLLRICAYLAIISMPSFRPSTALGHWPQAAMPKNWWPHSFSYLLIKFLVNELNNIILCLPWFATCIQISRSHHQCSHFLATNSNKFMYTCI